ncbi:lantibiotic dehydratase [Streptomyces sp. NPDC018045]|uniref:lantibiotic dehydratase n=1 Tax=Streptomyces sp. NPDC018045 TaxID=3365037 RepID=UPI0037B86DD0
MVRDIPLANGWSAWSDVALRSAGFPAELTDRLGSPELAAAADAAIGSTDPEARRAYLDTFASAAARMTGALQQIAADRNFREAVAWQNPRLLTECLDKTARGERRNVKGRNHEATVAAYLQRYCLKNDTIGYFGPVSWAHWREDLDEAIGVDVHQRELDHRTLYHESWAVDAIAAALGDSPELRAWTVPRPNPAHHRLGGQVRRSGRPVLLLTPEQEALLDLVDGVRTVGDIAEELAWSEYPDLGDRETAWSALSALAEDGVLHLDWTGPVETRPEESLAARIGAVKDPSVREKPARVLERYLEAAGRVQRSAGDPEALYEALRDLGALFTEITGEREQRREGQTYAGRTLVYEDTVGSTRVWLGEEFRRAVGEPLSLLLQSAAWLVHRIAGEYEQLFTALYERRSAQAEQSEVPLTALLSLATPYFFHSLRALPDPVRRAISEFQRRWSEILGVQDGGDDVVLSVDAVKDAALRAFATDGAAPWATGRYHSPDLLIAAESVEAVNRGDFVAVMGEIHVALNSLEGRVFVEQHDDPQALRKAAADELGDERIYAIPAKEWHAVSSRLAPPSALLSPEFRYWTMHRPSIDAPGPVWPAADLYVRPGTDGRLLVHDGAGRTFGPLTQVLGEFLSASSVNAFAMIPAMARRPRVQIGTLVVARRAWRFTARDLAWSRVRDERERFLAARAWRRDTGLPERAFYVVPIDDKPVHVDFTSIVYVNALAKAVRQTGDVNGEISLSEMLPDPSQLWLRDGEGRARTCELRMLAVPRKDADA